MASPDELKDQSSLPAPLVESVGFWENHRLSLLLIIAISIAIILTVFSVSLYTSSGAAQLDLSRPGYRAVSDKVEREDKDGQYSAVGPVTPNSINEFTEMYDNRSGKVTGVDAFSGDPLNPEVLVFGSKQ